MRNPRIDPSVKIKKDKIKAKQKQLEVKTGKSTSNCDNCGSLPIIEFQVSEKQTKKGGWKIDRLCKPCRKKHPKGPARKKFVRNNPLPSKARTEDERREVCSKYQKQESRLLTDRIIRARLKTKGFTQEQITPEAIIAYRRGVLEKRGEQLSKKVMAGKKYRQIVKEITERNAKKAARFKGKGNTDTN